MSWYSIFYWLTVADGVKQFFDIASNTFTTFAILSFIATIITGIVKASSAYQSGDKRSAENNDVYMGSKIVLRWVLTLCIAFTFLASITWAGYIFTPSRNQCLVIVAGGAVGNFITSDSNAKAIPSELSLLLRTELKDQIKNVGKENLAGAKEVLGVETPKDKLIKNVKQMTKEQLIEYLEQDSNITINGN